MGSGLGRNLRQEQVAEGRDQGIPADTSFWFQAWVVDPSAPMGYGNSNGLVGTTP